MKLRGTGLTAQSNLHLEGTAEYTSWATEIQY
jgi:hypothetical protein